MRRLLSLMLIVAMVFAPCVVSHAVTPAAGSHVGTDGVGSSTEQSKRPITQLGPDHWSADSHNRHFGIDDHNGHGHDCDWNCDSWFTKPAIDNLRGLAAGTVEPDQPIVGAARFHVFVPQVHGVLKQLLPAFGPPVTQISILRQTARLRI